MSGYFPKSPRNQLSFRTMIFSETLKKQKRRVVLWYSVVKLGILGAGFGIAVDIAELFAECGFDALTVMKKALFKDSPIPPLARFSGVSQGAGIGLFCAL
jgi:hypothetical protein